MSSGELF